MTNAQRERARRQRRRRQLRALLIGDIATGAVHAVHAVTREIVDTPHGIATTWVVWPADTVVGRVRKAAR